MRLHAFLWFMPAVSLLVGLGAGVLIGPVLPGSVDSTGVARAQAAGGMGIVVAPEARGAQPEPLTVAAGTASPAAPVEATPELRQQATYVLMQHRAQQAAPLVGGLQSNPDVLLRLMSMVRDDPSLRREALERMQTGGGMMGVASGAITEEMLDGALRVFLANPERLQGVLGAISANPQLMQNMLGGMGLEGVTSSEINTVMGALQQNPNMLGGLVQGDPRTIDYLADRVVGVGQSGAQGMDPNQLAQLAEQGMRRQQQAQSGEGYANPYGGAAQGGGYGVDPSIPTGRAGGYGAPAYGQAAAQPGYGVPQGYAGQPVQGYGMPAQGAMPGGQGGADLMAEIGGMGGMGDMAGLQNMMNMAGMGGAGGMSGLEAMGGGSAFGSEMLGAGATLSMLADVLGMFGGGARGADLQAALRAGDVSGILSMTDGIYGPNGSLSQAWGQEINSYTDLLNAMVEFDY